MSLRAASANLRFGGVLNQTFRIKTGSRICLPGACRNPIRTPNRHTAHYTGVRPDNQFSLRKGAETDIMNIGQSQRQEGEAYPLMIKAVEASGVKGFVERLGVCARRAA
jgi:hypothetical protein